MHKQQRMTPTATEPQQTPVTGQSADLETCAKVPGASGATQMTMGQPNSHNWGEGATRPPPPGSAKQQRCVRQQKKKEHQIGRNARSKATGNRAAPHTVVRRAPARHRAMHGGTTRSEHRSNHQMRRTGHQQRAPPPPFPPRGARELHNGGVCATRAGGCPPRGWQQGRD